MPTAAADVLAIMRGMLDAAGERGEIGQQALQIRASRPVLGYLSTAGGDQAGITLAVQDSGRDLGT